MVKVIVYSLILLLSATLLKAENIISIDMELYNTLMRTRDSSLNSYWGYGIAGKGALSFKSTGNKNVRADLAVNFNYPDLSGIPVITLEKAYVKAKFPILKLTVGKTRLGWGDGFVFNSGDVVFGSISPYVNLIGSEVRTETAWLTSVNFPIGRFSFIEAVVKAPDMLLSMGVPSGLGRAKNLGFGGRLYTKLGGLKIEAGYFFDGTDVTYDINHTSSIESLLVMAFHRPYISLQGNLGVDFYLNSSLAIPASDGNNLESILKDTWNLSLGLFHLIEVGRDNSLTLRAELVVLPFLNWREIDGVAGSYAMLIYPEIALAVGQNLNFSIRSIISPVDFSAQITGGMSWNVFEGFSLLLYGTLNAGDGNDTFSWNKTTWIPGKDVIDGVSMMAGVKYIY